VKPNQNGIKIYPEIAENIAGFNVYLRGTKFFSERVTTLCI
jgi:hypothetical protein